MLASNLETPVDSHYIYKYKQQQQINNNINNSRFS